MRAEHKRYCGMSISSSILRGVKAIVLDGFGGPEVLKLLDVPDPIIGPDDVEITVRATAVNRADLIQRMGAYPAPPDAPPDIPGLELAGDVSAIGARVRNLAVGDRVFGLVGGGAYAEKVRAHAETFVKMPDELSYTDAASLPEGTITAYDAMIVQGGLAAGDWVLISAVASGVGTAAVQIARAIGARTIGTSRTAAKLAPAIALGLDVGLTVKDGVFADAVRDATKGHGADVILELVGGAYVAEDLQAAAQCGRIILVGLTGGAQGDVNLGVLLRKRITLKGTVMRARPLAEKIAAAHILSHHIVPLITRGLIKPCVHAILPLRDVGEAHTRVAANEGVGKFVLEVS